MTRKITSAVLLGSMLISAAVVTAAVSAASSRSESEGYSADLPPVTSEAVTTFTDPGYYLREYNGELAVFRGGSTEPFRKLGVSLHLMTDEDRLLLREGIFAQNEAELKKLIEDYTS